MVTTNIVKQIDIFSPLPQEVGYLTFLLKYQAFELCIVQVDVRTWCHFYRCFRSLDCSAYAHSVDLANNSVACFFFLVNIFEVCFARLSDTLSSHFGTLCRSIGNLTLPVCNGLLHV